MRESTSQAEMLASQFGDARELEKHALWVFQRLRGSTLIILLTQNLSLATITESPGCIKATPRWFSNNS